jgi:hypothetical protein
MHKGQNATRPAANGFAPSARIFFIKTACYFLYAEVKYDNENNLILWEMI